MSKSIRSAASSLSRAKRLMCVSVSVVFCLIMIFSVGQHAGAASGNLDASLEHGTQAVNTSLNLMVNDAGDAPDLSLDGVCDTSAAVGEQCTLRAAIQETNNMPGDDAISFAPILNGGTITLDTALDDISDNLVINGPGATLLTVQRNAAGGTPDFRIFTIATASVVTISGLTVSNGKSSPIGGGILNNGTGTLNIITCVVSGNIADEGGGIGNKGTANILNSTISGNTANFNSGGIDSFGAGGIVNVINSTISDNTAGESGGGFENGSFSSTVNVTNSTVSGNKAQNGGGILNSNTGTVTILNSTVSGNTAPLNSGGGITNAGTGTITIKSSIVALNTTDLRGMITSEGYNIIKNPTGATITVTTGDQFGIDPLLERDPAHPTRPLLRDNGGPTMTIALLPGSPALDAGNNALVPQDTFDLDGDSDTTEPIPFDQRGTGFSRVVDADDTPDTTATVDTGAFEAQVSVQDIADQETGEGTQLSFQFNVSEGISSSSVTAASSDQALVPNGNISVTGASSPLTLTITPAADNLGSATISVTVTSGGQSMTDTFVLSVSPIAHTPSVANATTSENTQSASGLVISRNAADGPEVTHFKVTAITNGKLYRSNGTTQILNNTFVPFSVAGTGLKFTPTTGLSSPSSSFSFKVQASTSATDAGLGGSPVTAIIRVNEGGVLKFSAPTYRVSEGIASMTIAVTRTGGSGGAASIKYATSNGTATGGATCTAGKDYQTKTGTLSWVNGDAASKTFRVPICTNDVTFEGNETVNLTLSNVTGSASLGTSSTAVLTIVDNETQPRLSINNVTVAEGNASTIKANFTVKLSGASSKTVTVKYATANGTATAPSDYTAVGQTTLTFTPGQTSKTITVMVKGETLKEGNETFFVNLSGAANATITDAQGQGTITNDD